MIIKKKKEDCYDWLYKAFCFLNYFKMGHLSMVDVSDGLSLSKEASNQQLFFLAVDWELVLAFGKWKESEYH